MVQFKLYVDLTSTSSSHPPSPPTIFQQQLLAIVGPAASVGGDLCYAKPLLSAPGHTYERLLMCENRHNLQGVILP